MRRLGIITALLMLLTAVSASAALAVINPANAPGGTHLQSGDIGCTVEADLSVTCSSFELAGVGNTNADVSLIANYSASINCTNKGGNLVEVHTVEFSAGDTFTATSLKNGRLRVDSADADPFAAPQVCPNPNWRPSIAPGTLVLEDFTYTVTPASRRRTSLSPARDRSEAPRGIGKEAGAGPFELRPRLSGTCRALPERTLLVLPGVGAPGWWRREQRRTRPVRGCR